MSLFKLKPSFKEYIWGGRKLIDEYNKQYDGEILAESWELSCHKDGPSYIANGEYEGLSLVEYINEHGKKVLGSNCDKFDDFPILIKLIDAKKNLSVQVHPNNEYALKNEGQYGKTEMWYVIDHEPNAKLYYGFKDKISRSEFEERIKNNTLIEALNEVTVKKGDVFFIESGTIHAIGAGILIAEIQQNSNVTYRVYDYGRKDKNGNQRELHTGKALEVTELDKVRNLSFSPDIAVCDYFKVDKVYLDGENMNRIAGVVTSKSFLSILIIDGEGTITNGLEKVDFKKGDSLFMTAASGGYEINGACEALLTSVR